MDPISNSSNPNPVEPSPAPQSEGFGDEVVLPPVPAGPSTPMPPDLPPVRDGGPDPTSSFRRGTLCQLPDGRLVTYDGRQPFQHMSPCPPGYVPPEERGRGGAGEVVGDDPLERCQGIQLPSGEWILPADCRAGSNLGVDLSDCLRNWDQCRRQIIDDIEREIEPAERCCSHVTNIIIGDLDNDCDRADRCVQKCSARVQADITDSLTACYYQTSAQGLPIPSDAQVELGNATGEQLASCFIDRISESGLESSCWPEDLLGPNPFPCADQPREDYCPPPPPPVNPCNLPEDQLLQWVIDTTHPGKRWADLDSDQRRGVLERALEVRDECRDPGRKDCPPAFGPIHLPDWCLPLTTEQVLAFAQGAPSDRQKLKEWLGVCKDSQGRYGKNPFTRWLYEASLIPDWIPDGLNALLETAIDVVWTLNEVNGKCAEQNRGPATFLGAILQVARIAQRWLGVPSDDWMTRVQYSLNALCPTRIPSTAEANSGYLSGAFSQSEWNAMVRANNDCDLHQLKLVYGSRNRPGARDLVDLLNRQAITPEQFAERIREQGVLQEEDANAFRALAQALPGISDIVRFMLRDVADPAIVERYQYDAEFKEKWQGRLLNYATAQGITPELALDYWRAHWDTPSNTQAFEMLHRLRPGAVPKEIEVTEADVENMLAINDLLPYWRERMMAISYAPLTRVDTQRAFFIGKLTEKEVYESYRDLGYNDSNARKLVEFTKGLKTQRDLKAAGVPTLSAAGKAYAEGKLGLDSYRRIMRLYDLSPQDQQARIDQAEAIRNEELRNAKLRLLRRRYKRWEISKLELRLALADLDLDEKTVTYLSNRWELDLTTENKLVTAAQLCKAKERDLISATDYMAGLLRLGYTREDAETISGLCNADIDKRTIDRVEKMMKEKQRQLDREKREREKQQRDAERREKDRERKAEKKKKEDEKAAKAAK